MDVIIRSASRWSFRDLAFLRSLRNQEVANAEAGWYEHLRWVWFYWPPLCKLAMMNGVRVGYVRMGVSGIVSVAVSPGYRRQGIGTLLLKELPWDTTLYARICSDNKASLLLFLKAGFLRPTRLSLPGEEIFTLIRRLPRKPPVRHQTL